MSGCQFVDFLSWSCSRGVDGVDVAIDGVVDGVDVAIDGFDGVDVVLRVICSSGTKSCHIPMLPPTTTEALYNYLQQPPPTTASNNN